MSQMISNKNKMCTYFFQILILYGYTKWGREMRSPRNPYRPRSLWLPSLALMPARCPSSCLYMKVRSFLTPRLCVALQTTCVSFPGATHAAPRQLLACQPNFTRSILGQRAAVLPALRQRAPQRGNESAHSVLEWCMTTAGKTTLATH